MSKLQRISHERFCLVLECGQTTLLDLIIRFAQINSLSEAFPSMDRVGALRSLTNREPNRILF